MDYKEQTLKMLNIEPGEIFHREGDDTNLKYKFNEDLILIAYHEETKSWCHSNYNLTTIISGHFRIRKIPKITEKEQLAIDYLKECGYKWIAKDKDDKVFAFKTRPLKNYWSGWESASYVPDSLIVEIPISFISKDEPYYIGD